MAVYVVSYDLRQPGRNYQSLYSRLAEWKAIRCLESVWVIKWDSNSSDIRDDLKTHIDANDGLLVLHLTGEGAWSNLVGTSSATLKNWLEGK